MAGPATYWVRLAPYNPHAGNCVRKFGFLGTVYRGGVRPTWYNVKLDLMQLLCEKRQEDGNPRSPLLFEVYTGAERKRVDAEEERSMLEKLGLVARTAPEPVTRKAEAMDLTQGGVRGVPVGRVAAIPEPLEPLASEPAIPEPLEPLASEPAIPEPLEPLASEPAPPVPLVTGPDPEDGDLTSTELPEKKHPRRRGRQSS